MAASHDTAHDAADHAAESHGSRSVYLIGFFASVVLTAVPFWLVMTGALGDPRVTAAWIIALAFAQKKVRSMSGLEPQVRYRRLGGALARRGFAPGLCHRVISEVVEGLDAEASEADV